MFVNTINLKKFMVSTAFLSVFVCYLAFRIYLIRSRWVVKYDFEPIFSEAYEPGYRAMHLRSACIDVGYNPADVIGSARKAYDISIRGVDNSYYYADFADRSSASTFSVLPLDMCENRDASCEIIDLRLFVKLYFEKIVKESTGIFEYSSQLEAYRLSRKRVSSTILDGYYADRMIFETFGFMMAVAFIHEVFIDIRFVNSFYEAIRNGTSYSAFLVDELPDLSPSQAAIYSTLMQQSGKENQVRFHISDDPTAPFSLLRAHVFFNRKSIERCARMIFLDSYSPIIGHMQKGFSSLVNSESAGFMNVRQILHITVKGEALNLYDWARNCEFSPEVRNIWKALARLKAQDSPLAMKFFTRVTGFSVYPHGGQARFPKTIMQVNTGNTADKIIVPKPFEVLIPPNRSEDELVELIEEL